MAIRTTRWRDIVDRPRKLWGRVESVNPLVISHAGSVLEDVIPDDSMVPDLSPGDRIRYELENNGLTIEGRVSRNWRYEVNSAGPGWVTVARFPGNGRASATFRLLNDDSGDHDELLFDFQVAYSQASITLRNYNAFGRSSPGISAIRYLRNSVDATYGPGILQVRLTEALTGWSVLCEQPSDRRIVAMTPENFATSTSGYDTTTIASQCGVYPTETTLLALQNGHANYSGFPSWDEARVSMAPGSMVTLTGLVATNAATSTTLATLPEGCRPLGDLIFINYAFSGGAVLGRLQVTDTGLLQMTTPNIGVSGGYISLSGITYPAYQ